MPIILGKKIGMTQIWKEDRITPVTLIEAGPCFVTQVKTKEKDGYDAVQIGLEKKTKNIKKPLQDKPYRYLREFKNITLESKVGDEINISSFALGDIVKVIGKTKGKGFQGGVKRWGFHGRKKSHGAKHEERTIGSVGASFPSHVIKGKKMPGRMGGGQCTIKTARIVELDNEKNIIAIKGAIPGRKGILLEIKK
ncbi:MAG: 50S ribosomal protein L3 [Candidatus Pacebacteria bacterium]|nr:50S ribosomal protein L3 [Candidatus Paceibacterota bacterium]